MESPMRRDAAALDGALAEVLVAPSPQEAADIAARAACRLGAYGAALLTIAVPEGSLSGSWGLTIAEREHFFRTGSRGSMVERRANRARIRAQAYPGTSIAFIRAAVGRYNVLPSHHARGGEGRWRVDDTLYLLVPGSEGADIGVLSLDAPVDGDVPDPSDLGSLLDVERFLRVVGPVLEARLLRANLRRSDVGEVEIHRDRVVARVAVEVAHDVNNLLTVVIGRASEISADPGLPAGVAHQMDDIMSASETISSLCYRLLAAGRPVDPQLRLIQLSAVVLENRNLIERLVPPTIALEVELESQRIDVLADPGHILQILLNLVVNARDAKPSTHVRIETTTLVENGVPFAVLAVSDDGCGMSAEVRAKIFERFFTTRSDGAGVGLATVKRIVDRLEGRIRVESGPGVGTTVRVELPLGGPARRDGSC